MLGFFCLAEGYRIWQERVRVRNMMRFVLVIEVYEDFGEIKTVIIDFDDASASLAYHSSVPLAGLFCLGPDNVSINIVVIERPKILL